MQTLVHRETLADVYVHDDGSTVVHDFSPRLNPWLVLLLALPVLAVAAYFPLYARYGWEIAFATVSFSTIGPLIARRLKRHLRGTERAQRVFAPGGNSR